MINLKELEVTNIQQFGEGKEASYNIILNDKYIIQKGTDGEYSVPESHECYWEDEKLQNDFHDIIYTEEGFNEAWHRLNELTENLKITQLIEEDSYLLEKI